MQESKKTSVLVTGETTKLRGDGNGKKDEVNVKVIADMVHTIPAVSDEVRSVF